MHLFDMIKRQVKPLDLKVLSVSDKEKEHQKALNEMIAKSTKLNKLIRNDVSGWSLFCDLLKDYKIKRLYLKTKLRAKIPEDVELMKVIDDESRIIDFILDTPLRYIKMTEEAVRKNKENNDAK